MIRDILAIAGDLGGAVLLAGLIYLAVAVARAAYTWERDP